MDYKLEVLTLMRLLEQEVGTRQMIKILRMMSEDSLSADFMGMEKREVGGNRPNLAGERTIKVCAL